MTIEDLLHKYAVMTRDFVEVQEVFDDLMRVYKNKEESNA
jgi:hypothetical protein